MLERIFWLLLVLIAVIAVMAGQSAEGPPLEAWHKAVLNEEFTARNADEIPSFVDYQEMEQRLFAQLDEEVYARTGKGAEMRLVRYSPGSLADFRQRQPDWNRSVELAVDAPIGGVLLLHGMSDSPYSLRRLGEALQQKGYQVVALRLPGHGTAPSALLRVKWQDMAAAVRVAMTHLDEQVAGKPVHIIGYSTGAPLALDYTLDAEQGKATPAPSSLVLISPALGVSPAAALAKWKRWLSMLPGLGKLAWLQIQPEFDPYKYNSFSTNAAEQVYQITGRVATRIATRARTRPDSALPPILVLKSTVDATVSTDAVVDNLLSHLQPNRHEMVLFDINRLLIASTLLVSDPGPFTDRLLDDGALPFALTLVANASPFSNKLAARHKPALQASVTRSQALDTSWPRGVISLSHVALPFPPDDPLYGQTPPDDPGELFLGQIPIRGERGLLRLPADWLMRLRHNPFYDYMERRIIDWLPRPDSR